VPARGGFFDADYNRTMETSRNKRDRDVTLPLVQLAAVIVVGFVFAPQLRGLALLGLVVGVGVGLGLLLYWANDLRAAPSTAHQPQPEAAVGVTDGPGDTTLVAEVSATESATLASDGSLPFTPTEINSCAEEARPPAQEHEDEIREQAGPAKLLENTAA
jgi:hypothetical protein